MVESQSLQLVFGAAKVHETVTRYLSHALKAKGYEATTPTVLNFLSALECGVNYGSEIARNLGISRQMVAKTVKELCRVGYLEQVDGKGKQKQILFTELGECLVADARQLLAELDEILCAAIEPTVLQETIDRLQRIQSAVPVDAS
ncbi:MAG: MarR family transcriptional regulator [Leptolyngbya sp. SIO1D8]|nr:MarR family transcriptional regulator [Leptolyngbya sp. SIO1D8]